MKQLKFFLVMTLLAFVVPSYFISTTTAYFSAKHQSKQLNSCVAVFGGGSGIFGEPYDDLKVLVASIDSHLGKLNSLDEPANRAILQRLQNSNIGEFELRYYEHELIEIRIMQSSGQGYGYESARQAHLRTLQIQGIDYIRGYEIHLYGPDIYNQYMR